VLRPPWLLRSWLPLWLLRSLALERDDDSELSLRLMSLEELLALIAWRSFWQFSSIALRQRSMSCEPLRALFSEP
jgi:hypothetical protein